MTGDLSLLAAVFPKAYAAYVEFDQTMTKVRVILGSDGADLAEKLARTTYLNQQQAADAVLDCFAYGKNLEQTETVVRRADSARLSVRAVLQLEAQVQWHPTLAEYAVSFYQVDPPRMPEPGDVVHACTSDGTSLGSFVWPEPGQPATLREDLDAAIEAVADAPYEPVIRYRHPDSR